jgi:hypothetical protein
MFSRGRRMGEMGISGSDSLLWHAEVNDMTAGRLSRWAMEATRRPIAGLARSKSAFDGFARVHRADSMLVENRCG